MGTVTILIGVPVLSIWASVSGEVHGPMILGFIIHGGIIALTHIGIVHTTADLIIAETIIMGIITDRITTIRTGLLRDSKQQTAGLVIL